MMNIPVSKEQAMDFLKLAAAAAAGVLGIEVVRGAWGRGKTAVSDYRDKKGENKTPAQSPSQDELLKAVQVLAAEVQGMKAGNTGNTEPPKNEPPQQVNAQELSSFMNTLQKLAKNAETPAPPSAETAPAEGK